MLGLKKQLPEQTTRRHRKERAVTAPWKRDPLQVNKAVASRATWHSMVILHLKLVRVPAPWKSITRLFKTFRSILQIVR